MVGILTALLISWVLLWFYDRKDFKVLGFSPTKFRLLNFSFGFIISAICCAIGFGTIALITKTNIILNENFDHRVFLESSWWTLKSVLFEELVFRGALLYILIQKFGSKTACIISAISFGIYHWFSYGVFGNPVQMIYVFMVTGVGGLMFAYAYAFTKSLYLPIGLHFGWNFITIVIFSQGPLGQQLLISTGGESLGFVLTLMFFLYQILVLPFLTYWHLKRQQKSVPLIQLQ